MQRKIVAATMVFLLVATGVTTTEATAFGHRSGRHGHHGHHVAGYVGRDDGSPYRGRYYSLGPLGFTSFPPGSYSGYGTPISAWSW